MTTSGPIQIEVPPKGVVFAESVHAGDFQMSERADGFHKLLYVQRGVIEVRLGGWQKNGAVRAEAGTMVVVPAGMRHQLVDVEPSVILLLGLGARFVESDEDLSALWARLKRLQAGALRLRPVQAGPVVGCWRQAILEQTQLRSAAGVALRMLALQVLVGADRYQTRTADNTTTDRLGSMRQELDQTFFRRWTIDSAANQTGLSRRQFTLRFRQLTGTTFVSYLNTLRLGHAEKLLRSGRYSVTGAAFSSGFEDLSHFYRLFRARHRVSPKRWLRTSLATAAAGAATAAMAAIAAADGASPPSGGGGGLQGV